MKIIKKCEYKNIKEWMPIKNIKEDSVYLKDKNKIKLIKVNPINFSLKSEIEQINVLERYKQFLKVYNRDIQIIIQTDNIDLEKYINSILEIKKNQPDLSDMVDDYVELLKNISKKRESISRKFYIVTNSNDNEKIKNGLISCGNSVSECSTEEIIEVFKRYFKKNVKTRKEMKWV